MTTEAAQATEEVVQTTHTHIRDLSVYVSHDDFAGFAHGTIRTRAVVGKVLLAMDTLGDGHLSISLPAITAKGLVKCLQVSLAEIEKEATEAKRDRVQRELDGEYLDWNNIGV